MSVFVGGISKCDPQLSNAELANPQISSRPQMLSRKHGPQVYGATGAEGDGSLRLRAWSTSVWRHSRPQMLSRQT